MFDVGRQGDPDADKNTNTNASPTFGKFRVFQLEIWLGMWVH
jgi:hypothetical protein